MGPLFIFIFLLFGIAIASLIPAFLVKLLMRLVFGRTVFFGMVLLAMILGTVFMVAVFAGLMWYSQGALDLETLEAFETQMTPAETGLSWLFGFLLQVILLALVVADEDMRLIPAWKWTLVLILQYVVFFAIVMVIVFVLVVGAQAETYKLMEMV